MNKLIILPIVILLSAIAAQAEDIEVSHTLVEKEVYVGESAVVNIVVKNNQDNDDVFKVYPSDPDVTLPFSAFEFSIPFVQRKVIKAHQEETFRFEIFVKDTIEPDRRYTLNFNIKSTTDENVKYIKYPVTLDVVSPKELVKITSTMPSQVMPGEQVSFTVTFKNQANMMIDPAKLYVDSDLFSEEYTEKLYPSPYEIKKTVTFTPEPTARPGTYQLIVTAFKDKELRGKITKNFEVIANQNVKTGTDYDSTLFTRTITVTKNNLGNVDVLERYELPVTWFESLMTSYSTEPTSRVEGKMEWLFNLPAGDYKVIAITTDYRIFFFTLAVVLIAAIVLIYFLRRGMLVQKYIFKIKNDRGAVTELKVMIRLLNRTSSPVRDVKIIDIVPHMLTLVHEFGTLTPSKAQRGERGGRLVWEIDELEPNEERVISYKTKPNLHIIGKIFLPPALLRYRDKNNRTIDQKSNSATFNSEDPEEKKKR